jgi:hypothetical protein
VEIDRINLEFYPVPFAEFPFTVCLGLEKVKRARQGNAGTDRTIKYIGGAVAVVCSETRRNSMANEERFVAGALKDWRTNIERADKAFSGLTAEQLNKEIAPGKNRLIYLFGHLTAVNDRMLPMLSLGPRLHPELDEPFLTSPDRAALNAPSAAELKKAWEEINRKLAEGFAAMKTEDWLLKHSAVSDEDFVKEPLRNRFAILLSRTNHLSAHLAQAELAK